MTEGSAPAVELRGITKRFPGVVANQDIDITVTRGTVHAIVGENGAGKSTLMKILYGVQQPDEGTIAVNGTTLTLRSPTDAINAGIGMVFQHFMLADNFTVLENVVLGAEKRHGIGDEARRVITEISDTYGLGVDPDELVADLGVGRRQRVEILKILYRGARILILDEPTAVLVPQEVTELFDNLRGLTAEGLTVIFISHKLDEVLSVADEITVIRRGTTVKQVDPKSVNARQLAELMVGSALPSPSTEESTVTDRVVLAVEHVSVDGAAGNRKILDDISLTIHAGEVLGIAGVEGNGQNELVEAISGLRTVKAGRIVIDGRDYTRRSTRLRLREGLSVIPADRHRQGIILELPIADNLVLEEYDRPPFANWIVRNLRAVLDYAAGLIKQFDIRTENANQVASSLSGGNQQKLVVARELGTNPDVLVASQPTRGIDVGSIEFIHRQIVEQRDKGLAVLLVSSELDEVLSLSDRIAVVYRGRIVAVVDAKDADRDRIGLLMAGGKAA